MADSDSPSLPPPPTALLDGAALFLDFDGTLVELTDVPEAVHVGEGLITLLHDVRAALDGRLAIVSGRSVATLRTLFGLTDFILAGSHGLETARPGQPPVAAARLSAIDRVEAAFKAFAADKPGLLVEEKTLSTGLHYRGAPQWAEECRALAEHLAAQEGLHLQRAQMLYELRPGGRDKGTAIRELLVFPELNAARPVFLGDDVTDEDGFAAVGADGGAGILVGPHRATLASYGLADVPAVLAWLAGYARTRM